MTKTRRQLLLEREVARRAADANLIEYAKYTSPDYQHLEDATYSTYRVARHHCVISQVCHDLMAGKYKKAMIKIPPRHGKTELATKKFMSYYSGHNPEHSLILGTYSDGFAGDIGRAVRTNINSPQHQQVFPDHRLVADNKSANRQQTERGGQLSFVGRNSAITGRGGHGIIIDDPVKNRLEADSQLIRDGLWEWFTQVIMTRRMTDESWCLIIQTQWHNDDLVGRLTDPDNPYYDKDEAAQWQIIDLKALAEENDPLGRKPGEALWPERFDVAYLEDQRRLDPRGFAALYQGEPDIAGGTFFTEDMFRTYKKNELPDNLRYYAASDHAVSTKQTADKTCLMMVGVAPNDDIYILPETYWRRAPADAQVEAMLSLISQYKPLFWWAERGQISKSIGPFLRRRMLEKKIYATIMEMQPAADKQTRAQAIHARMQMGKVYFPGEAIWYSKAKRELMSFPNGSHDDFVDALSYIGLGLTMQTSADKVSNASGGHPEGTFGAMFAELKAKRMEEIAEQNSAGF